MADGEESFNDVRIIMGLERFGELVAHVAAAFAELRDIDPPNYDGPEMRTLAISSWQHVCFMADREDFKLSVGADLERIDDALEILRDRGAEKSGTAETLRQKKSALESACEDDRPQHRSEFGL